jgi:hypothetical protein
MSPAGILATDGPYCEQTSSPKSSSSSSLPTTDTMGRSPGGRRHRHRRGQRSKSLDLNHMKAALDKPVLHETDPPL